MEQHVYELEAEIERSHWWFVVRHRMLAGLIREAGLRSDAAILDIGSSTGGTLRHLRESGYTKVIGVDASEAAVRYCAAQGLDIRLAEAGALPFPAQTFDFVLACDIIEHVDADVAAALEVARVLKPGHRALFTVPAMEILWGHQDEISQHKRRYSKQRLRSTLNEAGFRIIRLYYFNYLLFLPILLARRITQLLGLKVENENSVNSPAINVVLKAIFSLDVAAPRWLRPPFGVSLAAEVQKPG